MNRRSLSTLASALVLGVPGLVSAHTLRTGSGVQVAHYHLQYCHSTSTGGQDCPLPDATWEAQWSISSSGRVYSGTGTWNCHGRTFDNRLSWVNYAEQWIWNDTWSNPTTPQVGDVVIWFDANNRSTHTVTIVGAWNSTSTLVMSKYGLQGQYRHALSNTIRVYGSNWKVYRFPSTVIYQGLQADPEESLQVGMNEALSPVERYLDEGEAMTWQDAVRESELLYAVERPRMVERIAGLRQYTVESLAQARSDAERVDLLLADLRAAEHYGTLGVYNTPAHGEDFILGLEASKLLAALADSRPELRGVIVSRLTQALSDESVEFADRYHGAVLHTLSLVLPAEQKPRFQQQLRGSLKRALEARVDASGEAPSYTKHYLERL